MDQENSSNTPIGTSLADIDVITKFTNTLIKNRSDIKDIVEEPLVVACQEFYDKNIQTTGSSANRKDLETGEVEIYLNYDTLSDENKRIAEQYAEIRPYDEYFQRRDAKIAIPLSKFSTVEEISEEALRIARSFSKQKPIWIPRYSIDEFKKRYGIAEGEPFNPEEFKEFFFYDEEGKRFFFSEEHFNKVKEAENLEE